VLDAKSHTVSIWGGRIDDPLTSEVNPLTRYLGLEDRFVVMYSGNAGIVHDFGAIFEAMRVLRDDPRIFFLFVGDGPRRTAVEAFAQRERLTNFAYRDYFARDVLRYSLSIADVHLISLRQEFVGVSVPSKLYGAMASARPILFVGPEACETADAIRSARCGVTVDPARAGDITAGKRIAEILRAWADVPAASRELGARGRCAFLERYDHRLSCAAFENVIRSVWGARPTVPHQTKPAYHLRSPRHSRADTRTAH
jgi:glycosyltransferase involved in cell wall biosynthesis